MDSGAILALCLPGESAFRKQSFLRSQSPHSFRRIYVRAKQGAEKGLTWSENSEEHTARAKAHVYFELLAARLKSCPVTKTRLSHTGMSFSAACKVRPLHPLSSSRGRNVHADLYGFMQRTQVRDIQDRIIESGPKKRSGARAPLCLIRLKFNASDHQS